MESNTYFDRGVIASGTNDRELFRRVIAESPVESVNMPENGSWKWWESETVRFEWNREFCLRERLKIEGGIEEPIVE